MGHWGDQVQRALWYDFRFLNVHIYVLQFLWFNISLKFLVNKKLLKEMTYELFFKKKTWFPQFEDDCLHRKFKLVKATMGRGPESSEEVWQKWSNVESTLGVSLYNYLYLKLAKMLLCLSYYPRGQDSFFPEAGSGGSTEGGMRWAQQCIHMWVNRKMIK
jgi:hypothetical protein